MHLCALHHRRIRKPPVLLCYAANAGSGLERLTSTGTQAKGDGVFVSRVDIGSCKGQSPGCIAAASNNLDQITSGDGTANTLMVTEKCGTAVSPSNAFIRTSLLSILE